MSRSTAAVSPAELGLGRPGDQVAHQRLRHARVDVVHRHVVAVVGAPAQRQLREVARADDEPADLVGDVHQDLRALARLGVFVGHVVLALVVADVPEVLPHGVADGDHPQRRAQDLGQPLGVAARARRGAEAGHGDGDDPRARQPRQVERLRRHQQRQRRVQPARDADGDTAGSPVCRSRFASPTDWMLKISRQWMRAALGSAGHKRRARELRPDQRLVGRPAFLAGQIEAHRAEGAAGRRRRRRCCCAAARGPGAARRRRPRPSACRSGNARSRPAARRSRRSASARPRPCRSSIRPARPRRRDRPPGSAPTAGAPGRGGSRPCPAARCWPSR